MKIIMDSEGFFDGLFDFMSPEEGEEPMWDEDSYRLNRDKRRYIADRDDWECAYCGRQLNPRTLVIDHYIPWSRGGSSNPGNLRASCRSCNREKYDMTGDEYEEHLDEDDGFWF